MCDPLDHNCDGDPLTPSAVYIDKNKVPLRSIRAQHLTRIAEVPVAVIEEDQVWAEVHRQKNIETVVLNEKDIRANQAPFAYPCISCGHCVEACPMHLNPCQLGKMAYKRHYGAVYLDSADADQ